MITRHAELIESPPTDEQAAMAEVWLSRLVEQERKQRRTELSELAPHVRFYIDQLYANRKNAISELTDRVEQCIAAEWSELNLPPMRQLALSELSADMVARVTRVTFELARATNQIGIDIEFIYPDPSDRRPPVNAA